MSLKLKLVLALFVLVAAATGVSLVLASLTVQSAARDRVRKELTEAAQRFALEFEQRQQVQLRTAEVATRDVSFVDALGRANNQDDALGLGGGGEEGADELEVAHGTMLSADLPLLRQAAPGSPEPNHVIVLLNASNELVYSWAEEDVQRPEDVLRYGQRLEGLAVLDAASRTLKPAAALMSKAQLAALPIALVKGGVGEDDLVLVIATPVVKDVLLGTLLTGRRLRTPLLAPLEALSRSRLVIANPDGAMASTDPRLSEALRSAGGEVLEIDGAPHQVERVSLSSGGETLGTAYALRNLDAELQGLLPGFRKGLLYSALLTLLLAVGAVVFLSNRISRPLVELESAAKQVRMGDLSVSVVPHGRDEVGRLAIAFNEMIAGLRQRDEVKGLFKRYLAPQVVDELLRHPEKAAPGGERRELTVLFSDLAGFTGMSEGLAPEELVRLLNVYFEEATGALSQHGATLDKFIGDAIMCFWNAPLEQSDHAARACLTVLELLAVVDRLRPGFATQGIASFDCRIGLNTGPCVVGNLGSRQAQDYTVIGDSVNLASRLEGACKVYGVRNLVSEETLRAAGPVVVARELDRIRVKGRRNPVTVFELIGREGQAVPEHVVTFAEGLRLFRQRQFAAAAQVFAQHPEDGPSAHYLERCEALLQKPPEPDWDGVHTLESK